MAKDHAEALPVDQDLVLLPLRSAVFCAGCDVLSNANGSACPACGSPSLFALAAVLDRSEPSSMFEMVCDA